MVPAVVPDDIGGMRLHLLLYGWILVSEMILNQQEHPIVPLWSSMRDGVAHAE